LIDSRIQIPEYRFQNTDSSIIQIPEYRFQNTDSRIQIPEYRFQNTDSRLYRLQNTDSRIQIPEYRFQIIEKAKYKVFFYFYLFYLLVKVRDSKEKVGFRNNVFLKKYKTFQNKYHRFKGNTGYFQNLIHFLRNEF